MNSSSEFSLHFRVEWDDYTEATICATAGSYRCRCDDSVDGLGLLADLTLQLAGPYPSRRGEAVWWMDGETWWALDKDEELLKVNLLEFQQTQQVLPGDTYVNVYEFRRCAFFVALDFRMFVTELVRAFDEFEALGLDRVYTYGDNVYPYERVGQLRQILSR